MLAEEGWGTSGDWETSVPADEQAVSITMWDLKRKAAPLRLIVAKGNWMNRSLVLTEVGVATALETLRARATAPRYVAY